MAVIVMIQYNSPAKFNEHCKLYITTIEFLVMEQAIDEVIDTRIESK